MRADIDDTLNLVVLEPETDRGRRIPLDKEYQVVGRETGCDVHFDDHCVSRRHAALWHRGRSVYVEDLGSSAGTQVNGQAAVPSQPLHTGDVLTFATVRARLESTDPSGAQTMAMSARPAQRGPIQPTPIQPAPIQPGLVQHVGTQNADVIHYDERQYNSYVQNVNAQRESFLREVAGTKSKARWLAWGGFAMFVAGFGVFAAADLAFIKSIADSISNGDETPSVTSPFGRSVGGVPIGLAGWALAAIGMLLLIVGIVLHVIATSRRKRAYREFPVLPPWPGPQPMRRG
jgi:pSer/pThr/pTyr-binding forkhead associated (FHA) protein